MPRFISVCAISVALITPALTQTAQSAGRGDATQAKSMTADDIIKMAQAGISDDVIIAALRRNNQPFNLSTDDMIRLKRANVSNEVLRVMLDPGAAAPRAVSPPPAGAEETAKPNVTEPVAPSPPSGDTSAGGKRSKTSGGFFHGIVDAAKKGAKQGVYGPGGGGPNVMDTVGLRNILPPHYDRYQPISKQFPHVAVTVLKSPPMWGDPAKNSAGNYVNGCWTLQAVVWSDEEHSKTAGPFDWCTPKDSEIEPEMSTNSLPSVIDATSDYLTGTTRTTGPRPPRTLIPDDRETLTLAARNTSPHMGHQYALTDPNGEAFSRLGHMFLNLRYEMGSTFAEGDFRVWIVSIR